MDSIGIGSGKAGRFGRLIRRLIVAGGQALRRKTEKWFAKQDNRRCKAVRKELLFVLSPDSEHFLAAARGGREHRQTTPLLCFLTALGRILMPFAVAVQSLLPAAADFRFRPFRRAAAPGAIPGTLADEGQSHGIRPCRKSGQRTRQVNHQDQQCDYLEVDNIQEISGIRLSGQARATGTESPYLERLLPCVKKTLPEFHFLSNLRAALTNLERIVVAYSTREDKMIWPGLCR
jgi:hypothetical protein